MVQGLLPLATLYMTKLITNAVVRGVDAPDKTAAFRHVAFLIAVAGVVGLVTALPLGEPQVVPLARGEVAAGGVELSTVDPRTMAVRGWDNLRVCGELLDIDGPVGGYNLQAAFSTGYAAGSV